MLLEAGLGDAYGAGFEFVDQKTVAEENTLTAYRKHALYPEIFARYTDDTQMAIALAELITLGGSWSELSIASKFVDVFKRDPRRGYSAGFHNLLITVKDGADLLRTINPLSSRNGAAMRAYVLGIYKNEEEVVEKATLQARVTHDTSEAIEAAKAVALAAHFLLYKKGQKEDVGLYLEGQIGGNWNAVWTGEVGMTAHEAVRAAITTIKEEPSLSRMLQRAVAFGGDVDTVATITLGCSAGCSGLKNDLPDFLFNELENGSYGRDYLIKLDAELLKMAGL